MLNLPRLLAVSNTAQMHPTFSDALETALGEGLRLVQLREKQLAPCDLLALALTANSLCRKHKAHLLVNGNTEIATRVGADGVHLPESMGSSSHVGVIKNGQWLCGVSVHSVEAARRAAEFGVDYLVFGSVFATASHPGERPQGLEALRAVTQAVTCPVYAIGGVTAANVRSCLDAGAHGVAVIGAIWKSPDIAAAVGSLLAALGEQ